MSFIREEISNEKLIKGVELRPPLYNRELGEYNDFQLKIRLWEEIARTLFPHSWPRMTVDQKDKAVRDIQKRWKNLRACFTRELRLQRTGDDKKRRKYLYFDKLKFLLPCLDMEFASSKAEDNDSDEREEDYDIQECTIDVPVDIPAHSKNWNNCAENGLNKKDSWFDFEVIEKAEKNSNFNTDPDTNFALSLVPWLKAVPFNSKLDAQMEILKTLKKFVHSDANNIVNDEDISTIKEEIVCD